MRDMCKFEAELNYKYVYLIRDPDFLFIVFYAVRGHLQQR